MDLTCRTEGKRWKLDLPTITDHPINQAVATFRLSTGHDCLAKHLHRIGIRQLPYCEAGLLCLNGKITLYYSTCFNNEEPYLGTVLRMRMPSQ